MKSIGEASKLSGINIETIRYYEREGIVARPLRSDSGRRLYKANDIAQLRFIRRSRDLGFSLADVRVLADLRQRENATCSEAQVIGEKHLEQVRAKIADLRDLETALVKLIGRCKSGDPRCGMLGELFSD